MSADDSPLLLDNDGALRARVNPAYGATVTSVEWRRGDGAWRELLYRAGYTGGGNGWRGQAPWLWPAVGRHFTPEQLAAGAPSECHFRVNGQDYPLPRHGFAMDLPWEVAAARPDVVRCRLTDSAATRRGYPFAFALESEVALLANGLRARLTVTNPGEEALPFTVGNHLSLALPLPDGSGAADAHLETEVRAEARGVTPIGFEGERRETAPNGLPLSDPLAANALLAGFRGPEVALTVAGRTCRLTVTQRADDLAAVGLSPDAYRFVLYADQERRFFCPEPWLGVPNSVNTGLHCARLAPGASFTWEWTLEVES